MGIEQIQKIHEFGEINVIISLLLCAMLVIALKAGCSWSRNKSISTEESFREEVV